MDQFKIESKQGASPGTRILILSGPFTLRDVFDFQSEFRASSDPVTIIDLSDVPYMDSAALGALVGVHTSSERQHRQYALAGVTERTSTLFKVGGVEGVLITYPTVAAAEVGLAAKAGN
jgi:anti-sigma B factor antagonist